MRVLTAESMRAVDRAVVEEIGIPELVLMEQAALGVVQAIAETFPRAESALVFCGPGNNGGDGLAAGRILDARGYRVRLVLAPADARPGRAAAVQLGICERLGLPVLPLPPLSQVPELLSETDLVVDALFGTGLARPLEGDLARLVELLASASCPRVAVDLPSGLSGSAAALPGPHFRADLTVTFAAPKVAHVLPPACQEVGQVVVADLGFPAWLLERAEGGLHLLVEEELAAYVTRRARDGHKGTFGHALVVAGGVGTAGAAILAGRAAVRGGAGLVTVAVPEPILASVDLGSLESLTLGLPASGGALDEGALAALLGAAEGKDSLAVGPGLGTLGGTPVLVHRLLERCALPAVVDADGLNALAGRLEGLRARRAPTLLTPHPGEMARLLGIEVGEVLADRLAAARRAAEASGAVVVLKGYRTLVATPEGEAYVNPTGNPGMATGGTGDVLTGLLAGLLAQGYEPLAAAQLGVFVHGLAGDLAVEEGSELSLAARDLLRAVPRAFARLAPA